MVLVSVLMGSYNHEKYISEAIQSVLNQTINDLELIVVDDCSTDTSKEIIQRFQSKDARVKAVFHDSNKGIAVTANDGLSVAQGRFVAFIGSDDAWFPSKLERQLELSKTFSTQVLWSDGQIINSDSVATGETFIGMHNARAKEKNGNLFKHILAENYIFGQSLLVKREFLEGLSFDPAYAYLSDYKFVAELAHNYSFVFSPEPLAKYRVHATNSILSNRERWLKDRVLLNSHFLQKYDSELSQNLKSILLMELGRAYSNLGKKDLAKHFYLKALFADLFSRETFLALTLLLTNAKGFWGNKFFQIYTKLCTLRLKHL